MSNYRQLYHGPYMRIWMPVIEITVKIKTCINEGCTKHKEYAPTSFCPTCGSRAEEFSYQKSSQMNLHEFLDEELDDEDMFTAVYPDNVDYIIAVPNRPNRQGGHYFEDESRTEILNDEKPPPVHSEFEHEDWAELSGALAKKGIRFEKLVGVLQWFS